MTTLELQYLKLRALKYGGGSLATNVAMINLSVFLLTRKTEWKN